MKTPSKYIDKHLRLTLPSSCRWFCGKVRIYHEAITPVLFFFKDLLSQHACLEPLSVVEDLKEVCGLGEKELKKVESGSHVASALW